MRRKYDMQPYTLDDHFSFGYGEGLFNPAEKTIDTRLWCAYSKAKRQPGTFREEVAATAKLLSDQAKALNRTPVVLLSGGMDSEVVVKGFIDAGVPFETATFRFKNGLNSHELRFVEMFLIRHGLKSNYLDIDALTWIKEDEASRLFRESYCTSCGMISHMKLMNHVWENGGMPILGNGDVYLENLEGTWKYVELDYMLAWFRHAIHNGILGGIGFFQHTAEVTLAMLREPKIERLGMNKDPYATKLYQTSRFIKYDIYRKHYPDLAIRPKFGGQEMVLKEFKARTMELLEGRDVHFVEKFIIDYADLRAMMEP